MDPEVPLPCSQGQGSRPYPQPDRTSPRQPRISLNSILLFMPRSYKWSSSLGFPHENPVFSSVLLQTCHMSRPSHPFRFDQPHNIILRSNMQFSPPPATSSLLGPNILTQHPILEGVQRVFPL
jgi:hypothetical protein